MKNSINEKKRAIEALELLAELRRSHSDVYLTLMSIVQGVSLALLFQDVIFSYESTVEKFLFIDWLIFLNLFFAIAVIWNEYRIGATMFKWIPYAFDSILPFVIFGIQAFSIQKMYLQDYKWCLAGFGGMYFFAIFGYYNMYFRVGGEGVEEFLILINRKFKIINILFCIVSAGIIFTLFFIFDRLIPSAQIACFFAIGLFSLLFLIKGELNQRYVMKKAKELLNKSLTDKELSYSQKRNKLKNRKKQAVIFPSYRFIKFNKNGK